MSDKGPNAPLERGDAAIVMILLFLVLIQNEPNAWLAGVYAAMAILVVAWLAWPERWRR